MEEFESALENAKAILADKNATKSQIDEASKRLVNAIHMLEFKKGDKSQLAKLIEMIKATDGSEYNTSTWSALQSELEKANKVIADENAMETEVKDSYNTLIKAYLDLRLIPDKSKLEELLNKAGAIDSSKYTNESVAKFNVSLANARAILDKEEASQDEIDEVSEALEVAMANLKEVAQAGTDNNTSGNTNNNNGGSSNNSVTDNTGKGNSNGDLPSTGGTSSVAVGLFATMTSLAGVAMMRKKRR